MRMCFAYSYNTARAALLESGSAPNSVLDERLHNVTDERSPHSQALGRTVRDAQPRSAT
jgi:hypothetical protein